MPPLSRPVGERRDLRSGRRLSARPSEHADPELAAKLGLELSVADQLAGLSIAARTHLTIRSHWDSFEEDYCNPRGLCALPADPEVVCAHLAMLAAQGAENGGLACDAEGRPLPGRVRPTTAAGRLAAINRVHRAHSHPAPGTDEKVKAVMAGIARTFGLGTINAKTALDLPLLNRLLEVIDAPSPERLYERAMVALRCRVPLSPGQLARLDWANITFADAAVTISFASPSRGRARKVLTLAAGTDRALCPLATLRAVADHAAGDAGELSGPVFVRASTGARMTRQGIESCLARLFGAGDVRQPRSGELPDRMARRRLGVAAGAPTLRQVRDRAMILTGWHAALRRSNLVALNWADTFFDSGEWEIYLAWQKNDQGGLGAYNWLVQPQTSGWPDPATAFTAWHNAVADMIGVDPRSRDGIGDQPVEPVNYSV
jgi:hypothetical protein